MSESKTLPRSTPESCGVSSASILQFLQAVREAELELHSFMLVRFGQVIAEGWWAPYRADLPHMLFSLSKSFTSSAIGFAVTEGLLSVDDAVISFFPEEVTPQIEDNMKSLSVKHLLTMTTGHAEDSTKRMREHPDNDWVRGFLHNPISYPPGTHFVYNSGASYMLAAIIHKVTGQSVLDYLTPRLLQPLAIEGAVWDTCPRGIQTGGWGLNVKTEDIAKFGQLYLQLGRWNGHQLLPEAWVKEATTRHVQSEGGGKDWKHGYGYQFWMLADGAYRGDGAHGQFCIVVPDKECVIAVTAAVGKMQRVLDVIGEHLLPSVTSVASIPEDPINKEALDRALSSLSLLPTLHHASSDLANEISHKRYVLEQNGSGIEAISISCQKDSCHVTVWDRNKKEHHIAAGIHHWVAGHTSLFGSPINIAACGTWTDDLTFELYVQRIESPFGERFILRFDEHQIRIESYPNLSSLPKRDPLLGRYK